MNITPFKEINFTHLFTGVIILALLYLASFYSYLLFHSLAEIFSIIVACGIFMLAWNSRRIADNDYILFLGIAFLFIGALDLAHTFAYKGMGVFEGYGTNLPTQLWIAARYTESLSFLIAPFFLSRRMKTPVVFSAYFCITSLLIASTFANVFPECFNEETGLTFYKKISEYLISLVFIGAIIFMASRYRRFEKNIFVLLIVSILLRIGSELAFTFYVSVYGFSNLVGHYLKIISFYLIYRAIIEAGLKKPYGLLFRDLKQNEEALRNERNKLKDALEQVRTLSGLLPICANCKKIRDDKGYWNQIESYIREHSDAEFSHSICPECARILYPDLVANSRFPESS